MGAESGIVPPTAAVEFAD